MWRASFARLLTTGGRVWTLTTRPLSSRSFHGRRDLPGPALLQRRNSWDRGVLRIATAPGSGHWLRSRHAWHVQYQQPGAWNGVSQPAGS
jgi:hypothetical protein